VKYKGDLLVITQDGLVPLSGALQSSRLNPRVALTDKIQSSINSSVELRRELRLADPAVPQAEHAALNVPVTTGNSQHQYVMNTITGMWCDFSGWNANCWTLYGDHIYFGGKRLYRQGVEHDAR
jgi:hypothetical protein